MGDVIRIARDRDAHAVAAIYSPFVERTPISFEFDPPTAAEMAGRIRTTLLQYPWLVCERDGMVAGYAYASTHHTRAAYQWSVDVAIYIDRGSHRTGIGRGLYTALFAMLVKQGYYNAFAGITLPNPGSVGLHEAMGFQPVGVYRQVGFKFGQWHDVGWWQLALQKRMEAPAPPVPFSSMSHEP